MSSHLVTTTNVDINYEPLRNSVIFEQDVMVTMRDGVRLATNVFRPRTAGRNPVIMAVSPYGKDEFRQSDSFQQVPGAQVGSYTLSDRTAFEAPDPNVWVEEGYVVIQADVRGQGNSEGLTGPFHAQDHTDYYDLIEWAGSQSWSSGKVALSGVSYLCISQWGAAALRPPHLSAVIMWEGWHDFYGRFHKGGIPETNFMWWLWDTWITANHNQDSGYVEPDYLENATKHPLRDEYWDAFDVDISAVDVPALVCASFSDQGLHTPDTFTGYEQLGSEEKWLVSHRQPKWESYYSEWGVDLQKRFLARFLQGEQSSWIDEPKVRMHVNKTREDFFIIEDEEFPPAKVEKKELFLDLQNGRLTSNAVTDSATSQYDSESDSDGLVLDYRFDEPLCVIGFSKLTLWVSAESCEDIDLFVGFEKIDTDGERVFLYGDGGISPNDLVARGWQRASHRALDPAPESDFRVKRSHRGQDPLTPGVPVSVEIELLPSSTYFGAGETLRLHIQGRPIQPGGTFHRFDRTVNKGKTVVHSGIEHRSLLTLPVMTPEPDSTL